MQMQLGMIQAQMKLAQAEELKSVAAIQTAQARAETDFMKREIERMQNIIDAAKASDETNYKYDKLESDEALALTELEIEANKELNQKLEGNR